MPRFGQNPTKSGVSKHRVTGSSSTPTINHIGNMSSMPAAPPPPIPLYSAVEAIRLRRAIRRCRPLLVKDLDPVDVVDVMSSVSQTPVTAVLRTDTVRESMLGLASSREELTVALLDRLDSVCFDVDGSLSSSATLAAFVVALRRNYRHVHAVLIETVRQLSEEEIDNDDFDDEEDNVIGHGDDFADDADNRERASYAGGGGGSLPVDGSRHSRRRERVAIAGDSVRKLLRRVTDVDGRNHRHRGGPLVDDANGSGSSTEMLNEEHSIEPGHVMAERGAGKGGGVGGGRSTCYYSSLSTTAAAVSGTNADEYIDCFVVPTRGRLQRREPWIHHASTAGGQQNGNYGSAAASKEAETESQTFMAVLTKDLVFTRIDASSIPSDFRHPPVSAPRYVNGGGLPSVYVVDKESIYSPVCGNEKSLSSPMTQAGGTLTQTSEGAAGNSQDCVIERPDEDCPTPPPPPVRTTSVIKSPPPPLPPKPNNLPSRTSASGLESTTSVEALTPPLPARQQRSNSGSNDGVTTTPKPTAVGRTRQLPPSPPGSGDDVKPEVGTVDDTDQNRTTTSDFTIGNAGGEPDYEPVADNARKTENEKEAVSGTDVVGERDVVSEGISAPVSCATRDETHPVKEEPKSDDEDVSSKSSASNQTLSPGNCDVIVRRTSKTGYENDTNNNNDNNNEDDENTDGSSSMDDGQLRHQRLNHQTPATCDSGIDSILSSNGCNDSPLSQPGSSFTTLDRVDRTDRRRAIGELQFAPAPSLSDILIGVDDNTEEFLRRNSRFLDDDDDRRPDANNLRSPRCRSIHIDNDDFSYYEDIDTLDGPNKLHRNATYLDPRSTSFNSADAVSMRHRAGGPIYSRSSIVRRNSSAASSSRQHRHQPPPPPPPPLSSGSLGFFLQPEADRKVLPAGTLLIAETVAADGKLSSAGDDSPTPTAITVRDDARLSIADDPDKTTSMSDIDDDAFRHTVLCLDREGLAYYVPAEALGRHGDPVNEPWFFPVAMSARDATLFLQREDQRGCFLVYRPNVCRPPVVYNLSVGLGRSGLVAHYSIVRNPHGDFAVTGHDHSFLTVGELVTYFRRNQSRLVTRLGRSLREARLPIAAGCQYPSRFELRRSDLSLGRDEVARSRFGPTVVGRYRGMTDNDDSHSRHNRGGDPVVVKMLTFQQAGPDDDDDFIEEALVLMGLRHENVARLVGISCSSRPFYVVLEWSDRGTLADYLRSGFLRGDDVENSSFGRRLKGESGCCMDARYDVCVQVASALLYLESRRFVLHRAVSSRSVIVCADDTLVKLAGFDRARLVSDDDYQADPEEPVFVRWAAPEVLAESRYSTKSDVWALGVLLWEIFSGGAEPYASMDAERTAVYVAEGGRLERPTGCPSVIYSMMRMLWQADPDDRPSFAALHDKIRGESSVYYTSPMAATHPPPPPSTTFQRASPWLASGIIRSASDDDRPPPPLPPPLSGRNQNTSTLLPLPTKAKTPSNKTPSTPTSRRPKLNESVTTDRVPRTPSNVRAAAAASVSANASNSTSSDSSSVISAPISTATGNGIGDDASGAASEDMSRGEKIRKSLRKLIQNKKPAK